ncbi:Cytochrome P450 3A21 like protein [Argiope bruennichi]|uniref:Cytochrome P450 3A21 like protein n=1 Tax=Argiope bruennichi TaxID=94029 RepID=A0A8T0G3G2_ARGBR|nr:Cytochrome P450 3A21 like protein [Argiope bruennichi]
MTSYKLLMDTAKELSEDPKSELHEKEADDLASTYGEVSRPPSVQGCHQEKSVNKRTGCPVRHLLPRWLRHTALHLILHHLHAGLKPEVQERVHKDLVEAVQERREIPGSKVSLDEGSDLPDGYCPLHDTELQRYKELGRIYGHFEGTRALLSVGDPALVRQILLKDFHIFPNRRLFVTGDEMIDKMLSNVQGEDWKRIRTIITPTFSTGKIKRMMSIMKDCALTAVENFRTLSKNGTPIEAKRIYGAFTMDVIASSAFSTKIDSHNNPDNEFVKKAQTIFRRNFSWRFALFLIAPNFMRWLRISIFASDVTSFFRDVTLQIIEERKKTGQTRNDFLQLLMDTAKELSEDPKSELHEKEADDLASTYGEVSTDHQVFKGVTKKNLSINELVAQCVIFFLAGYDTTASTLSFITYMLALNPEVQERVHKDLVEAVQEANGELTYDAIQSVKYLDNIISETMRLFPPAVRLERQASADYELGETGIKIPKGMIVTIPNYAMHRDPEYFPNPEKFDPDRWTVEEKAKRDQYAYLPFGAGPRNCVGMRFALTEVKVCIALVILNFKINKSSKTKMRL